MSAHWTDALVHLGVCHDAVAWARGYPSLAAAWAVCQRGDWMLWIAGRFAGPPGDPRRRPLVLAACDCAALALRYVPAGEECPAAATADDVAAARAETLARCAEIVREHYPDPVTL